MGSISAAKSRVLQARTYIESGRIDEVEPLLRAAAAFLDDELTADEKAPVLAEIAAIRAALAGSLSEEDERMLSAARGKIRSARSQLEDRQPLLAEAALEGAESYLRGIADAHKADVVAEIAALRSEVSGATAPAAAAVPTDAVDEDEAAGPLSDEDQRMLSAARGKIRSARSQLDDRQPLLAEAALEGAESYLSGIADAHKADVVAEIAALRSELGGTAATAEPAGATTPAAPGAPASRLSDDDAAKLSVARGRVMSAENLLESRRTENIAFVLEEAEAAMEGLPEPVTADLVARIAAVRAGTAGADRAEDIRRLEDEIRRLIGGAESDIEPSPTRSRDMLRQARARMDQPDVSDVLPSQLIRDLEDRITDVANALAAHVKARGLDEARPLLEELEGRLADDPFARLDQRSVYETTGALHYLGARILGALRDIPEDDADVLEIKGRVAAANQTIDAASLAWGQRVHDAQISGDWRSIEEAIEGWEQEERSPDARPLDTPDLPKTGLAIHRIGHWLKDEENKTVPAAYEAAVATFGAAAQKLAAAYMAAVDDAEPLETPMRRLELDRPGMLAVSAEMALAGTDHLQPVLSRIRKLDERWTAEVAAIMAARQELFDQLSAEAEEAWPGIVSATAATAVDTGQDQSAGTTVLLSSVYNRAGWDFSGRDYDFSTWVDGKPVAGDYEPYVLAALEHAWYELKLDVNDRFAWDVIAVVEGAGKIGERTTVVLRSAETNLEIGKIEEYPPVDCTRVRIIGLHAGPVAVGPPA